MFEYNLERFILAQKNGYLGCSDYATALNEIRNGRKSSHWMWYIFPQVKGLGRSSTSQIFAIQNKEEAKAFLEDPYLGNNLNEICEVLLRLDSNNAIEILGKPDDKKLRSSMTLFACVAGAESIYAKVLDKFFQGKYDNRTMRILNTPIHENIT